MVSEIASGLLVLVGIAVSDTERDADALAAKIAVLRVFSDEEGKMNRSMDATGGSVLVVSQFTLQGSVRKGRRPGFTNAAQPEVARPLVNRFVSELRGVGLDVATGAFGDLMAVELVNDGPLTLVIDVEDGAVR